MAAETQQPTRREQRRVASKQCLTHCGESTVTRQRSSRGIARVSAFLRIFYAAHELFASSRALFAGSLASPASSPTLRARG
eukprot:4859544-Lingulodinium_polyedra.AAC.1